MKKLWNKILSWVLPKPVVEVRKSTLSKDMGNYIQKFNPKPLKTMNLNIDDIQVMDKDDFECCKNSIKTVKLSSIEFAQQTE